MAAPLSPNATEKKRLRSHFVQVRKRLSPAVRSAASLRIATRLATLPEVQNARGVHCFLNLPDEMDTEPILMAFAQRGVRTYVPVVSADRERIECTAWQPGDPLEISTFGLREPPLARQAPVDLRHIDIVLVPGLAFDSRGYRIGFGKGYYDEFIARLRAAQGTIHGNARGATGGGSSGARLVGLAFAVQLTPRLPSDPWDIPVHCIVTDTALVEPINAASGGSAPPILSA